MIIASGFIAVEMSVDSVEIYDLVN